jgi:hypothetical protein
MHILGNAGHIRFKTLFDCAGKETGNSKFQAAQDKGTPLIDEDGLLSLVKASLPFAKQEEAAQPAAASTSGQAKAPAATPSAPQPSASAGPGAGAAGVLPPACSASFLGTLMSFVFLSSHCRLLEYLLAVFFRSICSSRQMVNLVVVLCKCGPVLRWTGHWVC